MTNLLVALIVACGVWAVVAGLLIARDLEQRGLAVDLVWLRGKMLSYLGQYRQVTLEETGRVGPLFYRFTIPLCVALVLVILLVMGEIAG